MLLEIKDLHVKYGNIEALHGISFHVNKGEIVTLIGADGANLKQLTSAPRVADFDPLYLPDGSILWQTGRRDAFLEYMEADSGLLPPPAAGRRSPSPGCPSAPRCRSRATGRARRPAR